jgi:hypothetical protein
LIKLKEAEEYFIGAELDLIYVEELNMLDVCHSLEQTTNLSFKDYIGALRSRDMKLWLDIKNLNKSNANTILKKIETIFKEYGYSKNNVLIETRFPGALGVFLESGYKTSYYLPYLHLLDEIKRKDTILYINKKLRGKPNIGISADYLSYPIIKKAYPLRNKYFWAMGNTKMFKNYFLIRNMLNDSSVKTVLVSF